MLHQHLKIVSFSLSTFAQLKISLVLNCRFKVSQHEVPFENRNLFHPSANDTQVFFFVKSSGGNWLLALIIFRSGTGMNGKWGLLLELHSF